MHKRRRCSLGSFCTWNQLISAYANMLSSFFSQAQSRVPFCDIITLLPACQAIISAYRDVQFCGRISSLPGGYLITAKGAHYNGGKIDHKLQHSIHDIITVLMIFFCNTDDIIHLSLLLGSILSMEVLLDFQDGGILEFGGFEIDITQDYLRSGI